MVENKLKVRSMEELGALFGGSDEVAPENDTNGLAELTVEKLINFRKVHPFNAYNDEKTASMVDSIKEFGVLEPLIVRLIPDSDTYEIIAGHNRRDCAVLAGLKTVPCIIKEIDDNVATLIMIATNLNQREKILPSERARAYKLQYETLEAMGMTAIADEISEAEGMTKRSIYMYLRLNNLIDEFMNMVDDSQIIVKVAVALSYLSHDEQEELLTFISEQKIKLNEKQAEQLKSMSESGKWNLNKFCELGSQKPKIVTTLSIKGKKLEKYFPKNTSKKEIEDLIFSLLEKHFSSEQ